MKIKKYLKSLGWPFLFAVSTLVILFILGEFAVDYIDPVSGSPVVGTPSRPWWANGIPFTYLEKSGDCPSGCGRAVLSTYLLANLAALTIAYKLLILLTKKLIKKLSDYLQ
ncbi:hypothetical protein JW752_03880 [Candidatus Peregrinibacteria bacterium]|nr:hypothetical protein [Candidatus Peregrinibacteria bacterium]